MPGVRIGPKLFCDGNSLSSEVRTQTKTLLLICKVVLLPQDDLCDIDLGVFFGWEESQVFVCLSCC